MPFRLLFLKKWLPVAENSRFKISFLADQIDNLSEAPPADAYLLIYNVTDRTSFESIIDSLFDLKQSRETRDRAIILVGNKSDLVRARIVTPEGNFCDAFFGSLSECLTALIS